MFTTPYHLWDVLQIGEHVIVTLPVVDLVHVQERFANEKNKVFALKQISGGDAIKTIVTRMM